MNQRGNIWLRALFEAILNFARHDGSMAAAALSYFAVFSLFPLTLVSLAVLAFVFPDLPARSWLNNIAGAYLPGSEEIVRRNAANLIRARSGLGFVGLLMLIWSASAVFAALSRMLERTLGLEGGPSPLRARITGIIMVILVAFLLIVSLIGSTVASFWVERVGGNVMEALSAAAGMGMTFLALILLYRLVPTGALAFRFILPGALLATAGLHAARIVFAQYVAGIQQYEVVYGSVGAVILMLLWFYVSAAILILGAEFSAAYFRLRTNGQRHDFR